MTEQEQDDAEEGRPESPADSPGGNDGEPADGDQDAREQSPDQEGAPGTGDQS